MVGVTRARFTYDQLSVSQWVQGFGQKILDEQGVGRHEQMINYMADLMEDGKGPRLSMQFFVVS